MSVKNNFPQCCLALYILSFLLRTRSLPNQIITLGAVNFCSSGCGVDVRQRHWLKYHLLSDFSQLPDASLSFVYV